MTEAGGSSISSGGPSVGRPSVVHVNDIASVGSTLAAALRDFGAKATLLEPPRPGATLPYPWKAGVLPVRVLGLVAAGVGLRLRRPDLVHVHYARLGIVGPLAGRPYVLHCHGSDVRGVRPGSAWGREIGPLLRAAALVYVATPDLLPDVRAFRPDARFLPNPIDVEAFAPRAAAPTRDLLVGVRLDPIKGLDRIVETVASIVAARPSTSITVIDQGRGVADLMRVAGPNARLLPPASRDVLPAVYQDHRVAVGQALVGAMGNYELEALACGVPVLTAFHQGAAYPVPPPLAPAGDPTSAAASACRLLDDEAARRELGDAAAAWVRAQHAASAIARRLLGDYAGICPPFAPLAASGDVPPAPSDQAAS